MSAGKVAVVGLGAMGRRLAARLVAAGHDVVVWNRTPGVEVDGASAAATAADAAVRAEIVITMVADPAALAAVSEGPDGVAAGVAGSTTVIEMSTVGPAAIARLAASLPEGTALLDAPVLGSLAEVESGTLTMFVGGEDDIVARCAPVLSVLGRPLHVGPLGSGAAAKLVANTTLVATLCALGEALMLGRGFGLSDDVVFEVLAATPLAAQAIRRRPALEAGEYPRRYGLSLARKDADLILGAAGSAGVDLRVVPAARTWFADAEAAGLGGLDYSAVLVRILR